MFPSYVLENLYVKGSLKNTENGFKFSLKNMIDSGTITGMAPITVDDISYGLEKISISINNRQLPASQVSNSSPLMVYILSEIGIYIEGQPLTPGAHRLGMVFHTQEAGRLQFTITETLSG